MIFVIVFLATYKNEVNTNSNNKEIIELSEQECRDSGYDWVHKGGLCVDNSPSYDCGYRCDSKTNDYNKACYSNDECEGNCNWIYPPQDSDSVPRDSEGYLIGNCSMYKYSSDQIGSCIGTLQKKTKIGPSIACP